MEKGHFGEYTGNARCCAGGSSSAMQMSGAAYDAKEAYNKDLSSKARMHYLENDIADRKSAAKMYGSPAQMNADLAYDPINDRADSPMSMYGKKRIAC